MATASWSYSKLVDFEKCKKFFWLKHDQRVPEPVRPLAIGKTEHANDRGTRIHDSCENYVNGNVSELCPEAEKSFGPRFDLLRTMHKDGIVSLEGEWGLNRDWASWPWAGDWEEINEPAELNLPIKAVRTLPPKPENNAIYKKGKQHFLWAPAWLRMKLDAIVHHDKTTATVIDYKSGRKFGNEVKHGEQLQIYQLAAFMRFPELQTVYAEAWYIDQDEVTSQRYTRAMGLRYREKFTSRGDAVLACTEFPANPNKFTCKWCMYGPWGSGDCSEGVR